MKKLILVLMVLGVCLVPTVAKAETIKLGTFSFEALLADDGSTVAGQNDFVVNNLAGLGPDWFEHEVTFSNLGYTYFYITYDNWSQQSYGAAFDGTLPAGNHHLNDWWAPSDQFVTRAFLTGSVTSPFLAGGSPVPFSTVLNPFEDSEFLADRNFAVIEVADTALIPEPTSLLLLATGVVGLRARLKKPRL